MMSSAVLAGAVPAPVLTPAPVCSLCVVTATVWEWQRGEETQEEADQRADQSGIFLHVFPAAGTRLFKRSTVTN